MEKIRYRVVFNRKGHLNGDGKSLVQIECLLAKKKCYISTKIYITPSQWDKSTKTIVNHPNAELLNTRIWGEIIKMENYELRLWMRNISPTLAMIRRASKENEHADSFESYAMDVISRGNRTDNTRKQMIHTIQTIRQVRRGYDWPDITPQLLRELEQYYQEQGHHTNTIARRMQHIRVVIRSAINDGMMTTEQDPFRNYKITQVKTAHRFLTPDQVAMLTKLNLHDDTLRHTLDAFLFCCYTGLRYSDFIRLNNDNLQRIDNETWLIQKTKKTGFTVRIPISVIFHGQSMQLIEKYGSIEALADIPCNSTTNRNLATIRKLASIPTRITFHTARHTCATLLLHQSVPVTTVQHILGHTKISTTQLYGEVLADTILTDIRRANVKKKSPNIKRRST